MEELPKFTHDEEARASYVQIKEIPEGEKVAKVLHAGHGVMLDLDKDGRLVGVEIIH